MRRGLASPPPGLWWLRALAAAFCSNMYKPNFAPETFVL